MVKLEIIHGLKGDWLNLLELVTKLRKIDKILLRGVKLIFKTCA